MHNKEVFLKIHPTILSGTFDCANCFYGLQLDTYQNGCTHDCHYCWAKEELSTTAQWNNPRPLPIDVEYFRQLMYTVFETDNPSGLRKILEAKIPLRLGSKSDPFLSYERKYNITYEILKILSDYQYPSLVLTRSDLISEDKYLKILNKDLNSVQLSIPSLNQKLVKALEPGAPGPELRLSTVKRLMDAGIWTTVRLNPLFPTHPDGYYSEGGNQRIKAGNNFDFFQIEMIDQIAEYGCKGILAGFAHLNKDTLQGLHNITGVDLRSFMKNELKERTSGFKYSAQEIRAYYQLIAERCKLNKMEFSTCYLGLGESYFWKDQDLWADKKDCCNIKNHVMGFGADTNQIAISERINISNPGLNHFKVYLMSFYLKFISYCMKNIWEK